MRRSLARATLPKAALAVVWLGLSCGRCSPAQAPGGRSPGPSPDVLATVNGVAITAAEVQAESRGDAHQSLPPRSALEHVVDQELAAQRAVELGHDADPVYRAELQRMEAQLRTWKRRRLAEIFQSQEVVRKAQVDDSEARRYFEANASRLRTEVHVWQILLRDGPLAEQARRDLEGGAPFEAVAGRQFPTLPPGLRKPWDLEWLRWSQVPPPWRDPLDRMKPGQTSGVIPGPGGRFWILKLVDRRENPAVDFETVRPALVELLRGEKSEALREERLRELRSRARVVHSQAAAARLGDAP